MRVLQIAVVGARSRRQGTGEYVAREFARAGCRVAAVVGTSEATLREARERLAARYGIECRGYLHLADLLAAETVDAVAICSPPGHHLEALELALAAGCHAFCEKPLWWDDSLSDLPAAEVETRAAVLVRGFAEKGLVLAVNTQMPFTLDGFDRLHPGARTRPPESFAMRMSPITAGPRAVVDSAPHLLSLLYAFAGEGRIEDAASCWQSADGGRQTLSFLYRHEKGAVRTRLVLRRRLSAPRPLSYCVDGRFVTRRIEMPEYRIRLADRRRSVALRDPLSDSVDRFLDRVSSGDAARNGTGWELAAGMLHLQQLVAAARPPRLPRSAHGRQAG